MSLLGPIGYAVSVAASAGPNLYTHVAVDHVGVRETVLDAATDTYGVLFRAGVSGVVTLVGIVFVPDPTDSALPFAGGAAASIVYDTFGAPRVYRNLDMTFSALGWK